jgi:hypothetical protein
VHGEWRRAIFYLAYGRLPLPPNERLPSWSMHRIEIRRLPSRQMAALLCHMQ